MALLLDNGSGYLFPSWNNPGFPLSNAAGMKLVKVIGYADRATVHCFRVTFRTWATERTNHRPRDGQEFRV